MKLSRLITYPLQFLSSCGKAENKFMTPVDFRKERLLAEYQKNKDAAQDIMEYGERITHLFPNNCFYAHLSLYYLALSFMADGERILDAGSGSGYGSAYLAGRHRGEVTGIELSSKAVAFSNKYFQMPNLNYMQMDLEKIKDIKKECFDYIFASNVLEHVENVPLFLRDAVAILRPEGKLFIAVPSVVSGRELADNVGIPQHLNIWSPLQWAHILSRYFRDVRYYVHISKTGADVGDFNNKPEDPTCTEEDFALKEVMVGDIGFREGGYGVVFFAQSPLPVDDKSCVPDTIDYIDGSFTRPRAAVEQYNCFSFIGELWRDTTVIQSFYTDKMICQIDIMYALFARINTTDVIFKLKDNLDSAEALVEVAVNASILKDNDWYEYRFPPVRSNNGVYYIIIESPESVPGNAITVRCSDKKCFYGGNLLINDKVADKDIAFRAFEYGKTYADYHQRKHGKHSFHTGFISSEDDPEGKVYLLENGTRKFIKSPDVLINNMGFESSVIIKIAGSLMLQIPEGPPVEGDAF